MTRIAFGEWTPDQPVFENRGALIAKNCVPQIKSYRSLQSLESFTDALGSACLGSVWARARNASVFNFAGDFGDLYLLSPTSTWDNVSKSGGYSAANWEFAQFGERIIAVDDGDVPQYYDMNSSTTFLDLPGLDGSPPIATRVAVVRDFVVLGDVNDGTRQPNRIVWSGLNNSEQWNSSPSTQAGMQDLRGRGGPILRIVGGDIGTIFQERSITRMTYIGPPFKFRFDEVERARGAVASNGVAWTGAKAFYYASDGFYVYDLYGGGDSVAIGANRVDRWFKLNAAPAEVTNMQAAVDRTNSLVMWAFKSSSASVNNDRLLIYNWKADKWAYAEIDIQNFAEFASPEITLDGLDAVLPSGIDINSINVESPAFQGGAISILAFNSSNQGSTFSGPSLNVCLDTKEFGGDNALTFIDELRPLVEGGGVFSMTPVHRDRLIDTPNVEAAEVVNGIGLCEVRVDARYHRYRLTSTGDFSHALGIEFKARKRGKR